MPTPSTTWRELPAPGEDERLEAHARTIHGLQRARAGRAGRSDRALHAKANAGVLAELTVLSDLPEPARAGLFAAPATYPAYVRYSNGSGARQSDSRGDVRGLAVKVAGVPGKKVILGMEDEKHQDFLLIRTPAIPFRDADEFVAVVAAASKSPLLVLPRVAAKLGWSRALELLPKLAKGLRAPLTPVATTTYYSAAPMRCGAYAIHVALVPHAKTAAEGVPDRSPDSLHDDLAARLREGPVVYDLRVQFYCDDTRTPIEDASVEWKEEDAPWSTVARLELPRQDLDGARGRRIADCIEGLSFDPWHALVEHRPLGNIMRARSHAYRLSTKERGAAREPDGTERFE